jgi:exopolysaccharide biosynthesis polyprenyl glycosylphosphotransferase
MARDQQEVAVRTRTNAETGPEGVRRRSPHRLKLGSTILACALAAAVAGAASLLLAYAFREGDPFCGAGWHLCGRSRPYVQIVPFAALIRMAFFLRHRPWKQRRPRGFIDEIADAIKDAGLGSILLAAFTFMFRSGFRFSGFSYSRLIFVTDWIIATVLLTLLTVATKYVLGQLRRRGHNLRTLVVVGDGDAAKTVDELVAALPEMGYVVVGRVRGESQGRRRPLKEELLALARRERVDEVVLAVPRIDRAELSQIVSVAELVHLEIKTVPDLFGLPASKTSLGTLGHLPVLALLQEPLSGARRLVKRTMDLTGGTVVLVLASPVLLVCALAVRLTSKGPVLLRQERVGMDGRPFGMLKFRSMIVNADTSLHEAYVSEHIQKLTEEALDLPEGRLYKLEDDPRITSAGKFLRRFSLDELPQLFNVLAGEMSLVGPRPALPFETGLYQEWHRRRLDVRPGMTGLWQVGGRGRLSFDDMVRLDVQYIETWSPILDVLILLRTVPAVFRKETG